jgi:hypothetical protein
MGYMDKQPSKLQGRFCFFFGRWVERATIFSRHLEQNDLFVRVAQRCWITGLGPYHLPLKVRRGKLSVPLTWLGEMHRVHFWEMDGISNPLPYLIKSNKNHTCDTIRDNYVIPCYNKCTRHSYTKYCIKCHMIIYGNVVTFSWHFLWTSSQILSSQLTLSSSKCQLLIQSLVYFATHFLFYNEIRSRMIEIWMKKHLASDRKLQHCTSILPKFSIQGMTNNVRFTFSVGDTIRTVSKWVLSKTNRIGDTTYLPTYLPTPLRPSTRDRPGRLGLKAERRESGVQH